MDGGRLSRRGGSELYKLAEHCIIQFSGGKLATRPWIEFNKATAGSGATRIEKGYIFRTANINLKYKGEERERRLRSLQSRIGRKISTSERGAQKARKLKKEQFYDPESRRVVSGDRLYNEYKVEAAARAQHALGNRRGRGRGRKVVVDDFEEVEGEGYARDFARGAVRKAAAPLRLGARVGKALYHTAFDGMGYSGGAYSEDGEEYWGNGFDEVDDLVDEFDDIGMSDDEYDD